MQGVIKAYDPGTQQGVVMRDTDLAEFDLAPDALEGSVFVGGSTVGVTLEKLLASEGGS